jgi:hypothetical protein
LLAVDQAYPQGRSIFFRVDSKSANGYDKGCGWMPMRPSWREGDAIACNIPALGTTHGELFAGCRLHAVEHHLVLYVIGDREIVVARVLHERINVEEQF